MKRFSIAILLCILHCALCIAQSREQMGGIYFAYPDSVASQSVLPEAPDGFSPVYISHYGRHGSRWPVNPKAYKIASDFFQDQHLVQNLTDEGRAAWKLVSLCAGNANGHLGELTPLGERQHRDIAKRMTVRFPELFKEGVRVEARSSTQPRCIMSMAAFTDGLHSAMPSLDIRRHSSPGDMDFIHHNTEESELMNSDLAPWRWEFDPVRDSLSYASGVVSKLFKTIPSGQNLSAFSRALYDIGISIQNIDSLDADILSLFTQEELKNLWTAANYIQYVGNANSPLTGNLGPECAKPLLSEILTRAEEMLASGAVRVDLIFGHDTDLLRLVSLLNINGNGIESEDIDEVAEKWCNYDISPMAANLQLVFYRNAAGEVLVLPLLNEIPATFSSLTPISASHPNFYQWAHIIEIL